MLRFFLELFITGLILGWGSCLICTSNTFLYFVSSKRSLKETFFSSLIFSSGRIFSYIIIGGFISVSSVYLNYIFSNSNIFWYIYLLSGLYILFLSLTVFIAGFKKTCKTCQFIHNHDKFLVFLWGFIKGFVPCIPLIAIFSIIVLNSKTFVTGMLSGLVFGIATIISPYILIAAFIGHVREQLTPNTYKAIQRISGTVLLFLALKVVALSLIMLRPYLCF